MVARQFGLTQLLPRSLFLVKETVITSTAVFTEAFFKKRLELYDNRNPSLDFFHFEPSFICTEEFDIWWTHYYRNRTVEKGTLHQYIYDALHAVSKNEKKKTLGISFNNS